MEKANIGIIGLAVMGENLALNIERNGFSVALYNRTTEVVDKFLAGKGKDKNFLGNKTLNDLVNSLASPRKVLLMIKAGQAVDNIIIELASLLDANDIIIDAGNSNFYDTNRRANYLRGKKIHFVGSGVSGGEEGALNSPSLMPGGHKEAWKHIEPIFKAIAAKAKDNTPCVDWIGEDGAGHFVKMVHNGIEYGDMQLITEAYHLMTEALKLTPDELSKVFETWNKEELDSYLIEITAKILKYKDKNNQPLINKILDTSGQKGTGKWTGISALELGVPLTLITESVFSRFLSADKELRTKISSVFATGEINTKVEKEKFIKQLKHALFVAKITSYAQGFSLLKSAAEHFGWKLNYASIARLWRGGCIIRSAFLDDIAEAFEEDKDLPNLILAPYFTDIIINNENHWREIVSFGVKHGLPLPALTSALNYFDALKTDRLPANLIQAQRDYFGSHTYERIDSPRGQFFHTDWIGDGGEAPSSTYNV